MLQRSLFLHGNDAKCALNEVSLDAPMPAAEHSQRPCTVLRERIGTNINKK
jgi:hypothetical protein